MHVQRCFAHKTNCFLTLSLSSSSWLLKWCHIFHFCRESSSQGLSFFFEEKSLELVCMRFPFNQKVRFAFWQLAVASGTTFSKIFKKRTTSRGILTFSETFSQKLSFHSTLLSDFLEFSVEWLALRKFNRVGNFWKLFQEISVPFAAVSKFSKVLVEWKAPLVICNLRLASSSKNGQVRSF